EPEQVQRPRAVLLLEGAHGVPELPLHQLALAGGLEGLVLVTGGGFAEVLGGEAAGGRIERLALVAHRLLHEGVVEVRRLEDVRVRFLDFPPRRIGRHVDKLRIAPPRARAANSSSWWFSRPGRSSK